MKRMILFLLFSSFAHAADIDNDGIDDSIDNCLGAANPAQIDSDHDGYGNWCDADFTNDKLTNFGDLGYLRSTFGSTDATADLDGSGTVNFADLARFRALFGKPPGPSALSAAALLKWTAPTKNEDNTPLIDLAGYRVYTANDLTQPWVFVVDSIDNNELIEGLTTGSWYYTITAVDNVGNESVISVTGMKVIL